MRTTETEWSTDSKRLSSDFFKPNRQEDFIMSTSHQTQVELGTTNRTIRGLIGAGALVAIFSVPGLTAGWLFTLALVNAYASMTAILGFDFVGATITVISSQHQREGEVVEMPRRRSEEQEYKKAA
jgi:hypothetical protein